MRAMTQSRSQPGSALGRELDDLVQEWFEEFPTFGIGWSGRRSFPALNLWQDGKAIFIEAELPGVRADELSITVVGRDCTIRGQREAPTREGSTLYQERAFGPFSRLVRVPVDVKGDQVEATLQNGILTITLPKAEPVRTRTVTVKALAE
jgi:HSP20 family protein